MKKRILSLVLATLMIISVLPAHALADDNPLITYAAAAEQTKTAVSAASADGSVHVNKSVAKDANGNLSLTLEAYLTNEVTQTVSAKPLDIVLVLDQSGSMAYNFNGRETNDNTARRQYAMKQAVNAFIAKVGEQYSKQGDHQMAIVTFGTNATQLQGWTAVDDSGKTALTDKINGLPQTPSGATNVGAGMQKAQQLMSSKTDTGRQKVVIVFTDGVPTTQSDFDTDVANKAITAAKAMKDNGVTVYTVGIFNGANPAQLYGNKFDRQEDLIGLVKDTPCYGKIGDYWGYTNILAWTSGGAEAIRGLDIAATNRFLNYLSSNFATATEIGIQEDHSHGLVGGQAWEITKNFTRDDSKYYLTATDSNSLSAIFQKIVSEISALEIEAGTDTVLSDTLSQYFTLNVPANTEAKNAITVEKWDCTGKDADGKYIWKKADSQPTLRVDVDGKTINVTGFNYTENAVTATTKDGNTTYSGAKLVVTIPIKPDTTCENWQQGTKNYPTNDTGDNKAGLSGYKDKEGEDVGPTQLNQSPEAPVTAYTVTYTDGVGGEEIFADQTSTVLSGTATPAFKGNPTREGYKFTGWSPAVTDTVTGNVTYTAQWEELTYTVTYTDGVDGEEVFKDQVTENLKSGDKTPAFNGTPTREGYQFTGWSPAVTDTVSGNATYTAQWKQLTYTVTYTDGVDGEEVFKDQVTKNLKSGDKTPAFDGTPSRDGYEFKGWTPAVAETVTENATYTATWTEKQDPPAVKYKVIYRFESGTTGKDLPQEVTDLLPTDNTEYATGNTVTPETLSTTEVSVSDGKWEFKGWNPNGEQTFEKSDITFTGTWEFTSTVLPPEQKYGVLVQVEKDVRSDRGTYDGGEWFTFDISSDEDGVNKLGNLSVYFGETVYEGQTRDTLGSVILDLTKEQYDGLIAESFGGTEYKVIYLTEKRGSTEGMSYETQPVKLYLKTYQPEAIAYSTITYAEKYEAYVNPETKEWAVVTNVYNKLTDRDVTPAKVSPQLNRDDHVAYLMGYPDGKVRPEGEITRAEACTIFFRLLTEQSRDYYFTKTNDYTDVSRSDWFNNAISTLSNAGIVTGYADGTFRPDQPITRGEMAKIIANFAKLGGATKSFTDLSGHWAKTYVELAAGNGWIEGYPDGTFGPDKKITRAETVTMINRVLDRVPAKESRLLPRSVMLTFPDNEPGEWYYIAIQEATNSHTYQRSVYETAGDEMWIKLIDNVDWTKLEK